LRECFRERNMREREREGGLFKGERKEAIGFRRWRRSVWKKKEEEKEKK